MRPLGHLALFVTERCNLACEYCFAANMEGRDIDEGLARRAIGLLVGPGNPARRVGLSFWGGEPLVRFELVERLVRHARDEAARHGKKLRLSLPTNVTLLEDRMLDLFDAHDVALSLSCDGDEHAQGLRGTRGGGSTFARVAGWLERLGQRYGS